MKQNRNSLHITLVCYLKGYSGLFISLASYFFDGIFTVHMLALSLYYHIFKSVIYADASMSYSCTSVITWREGNLSVSDSKTDCRLV